MAQRLSLICIFNSSLFSILLILIFISYIKLSFNIKNNTSSLNEPTLTHHNNELKSIKNNKKLGINMKVSSLVCININEYILLRLFIDI